MFGSVRRNLEHLEAPARVREWTRGQFGLGGEAVIMVAEVECQVPGCPPIETIVAFWTGARTRAIASRYSNRWRT